MKRLAVLSLVLFALNQTPASAVEELHGTFGIASGNYVVYSGTYPVATATLVEDSSIPTESYESTITHGTLMGATITAGTFSTDPQTSEGRPLPSVVSDGSALDADVTAWAYQWGGSWYTAGSATATGTISGTTYTLDWCRTISGGSFNGLNGCWHIEGTYTAS